MAISGTAIYYNRSYLFRVIQREDEEQVPAQSGKSGTKPRKSRPEKLDLIFGLTNVRRANAGTKVNERLRRHSKRT
jgi:hypothetical protein